MSEELISRRAVFDLISSKLTDGHLQMGDKPLIDAAELMDDVSDLPIAYAVDKVVEQIEQNGAKMSESKLPHRYYKAISVKNAIDIVRIGGTE